jgi:hypothetical protein
MYPVSSSINTLKMSKPSTPIVVSSSEWKTAAVRYMQPKVNDRGGKSINIISTQSNRSLYVSTPLLMTWGISDFVDEKTGESDGKFSMSLAFPNEVYATAATTDFLAKLKAFENQILDDAVKNSEAWFGEEMSREVAKHTFFPFLKYSKDKLTKKTDFSKPPTIRAKVPNYNGKWNVEVYDTKRTLLFPCDNDNLTPMDFVPARSNVACVLQCGGLWFGGKGWGITWKLNQCVVKPHVQETVFGHCHIQLSSDDIQNIETQPVAAEEEEEESVPASREVSTAVADSDEEADEPEPKPEPVAVKKVVKKSEPVAPTPAPVAEVAAAAPAAAVVKKIIKKKAP